jgi:hypothetical protein
MGGGNWDVGTYDSHVKATKSAGKSSFDYSDRIYGGYAAARVHDLLDPKRVCGPTSPFAGTVMREVVLSDEHPNPTAIAVLLDVTGSNIGAARVVHSKLPQLLGLLQRKGYVEDPQLNFSAIGDANGDRVPLQMGSFESDNRIDKQLEAMYLEGGGGGSVHETYELGAYFLARHTNLEPYEKQGRKGYVFIIGDEMPYDKIRKSQVAALIGDTLESDIPTKQVFAELQEKFDVFFLFQAQGSYRKEEILPSWRALLGERALVLDDPAAVCEFIAGLLGMLEGGLDLDEAKEDLLAIGADPNAVKVAGKALATIGGGSGTAVARPDGSLPDSGSDTGSSRL